VVQLHSFVTSALYGDEGSASHADCFTIQKKVPTQTVGAVHRAFLGDTWEAYVSYALRTLGVANHILHSGQAERRRLVSNLSKPISTSLTPRYCKHQATIRSTILIQTLTVSQLVEILRCDYRTRQLFTASTTTHQQPT
jgi:hypothetical protein